MSTDRPSPRVLWHQANGDSARYRELLREHGHILSPGDEGCDQASATLPCGWPGPQQPASDWCVHEMSPGTCSICTGRGEEPPEDRDKSALGRVFTARYPAPCGWCGDRFTAGERVRGDQVNGGYVCEKCWS